MEIIAPIVFSITLIVPPISQGKFWNVEEVPNQLQVTFENGVQASYPFQRVPCNAVSLSKRYTIYKTRKAEGNPEVCYQVDGRTPALVRSTWIPVINKTYNPKETNND